MPHRLDNLLRLLIVVTFALSLSGCTRRTAGDQQLLVRLGWQVNANSAGQVVALEKGFYARYGLDVQLLPGGLKTPSVQTVGSGAEQIGFANGPDLVVNARAAGAPLRIVAVIQQSGYHAFFSRKDAGISDPRDWVGKRVGVKRGSPTFLYYLAALRKFGVDRQSITEVPLQYGIQSFLNGDLDVYPGALTNEGISIERRGIALSAITTTDLGMKTWGNVIFTSESELANNRVTIEAFVRATIEGWEYCLDRTYEDEVLDCLAKHAENMDREKEREALRRTIALVRQRPVGTISIVDLNEIIARQREFGNAAWDVTSDSVVDLSIVEAIRK